MSYFIDGRALPYLVLESVLMVYEVKLVQREVGILCTIYLPNPMFEM